MNHKLLGAAGMMASPFLYIDLVTQHNPQADTRLTGFFGLLYITGMICSILGMYQMEATGAKAGKLLLVLQLAFLFIAQVYNLDVLIHGGTNSDLQFYLDWFWPISNGFMLFVGIGVIATGKLNGAYRYLPLMAGLWLPVILCMFIIDPIGSIHIAGLFAMLCWLLIGWMIYNHTYLQNVNMKRSFT